jgi:hypothetical protein
VTGPPPGPDQVYLGWEYALQYLDPGPPPARPAPPGPEQVNPGWVAAQYRAERRLSQPATAGGALALALAVLCAALGAAGLLNTALTATGLTCGLVLAASCAWRVRRGARDLRVTLAREEQRVARARAVWNGQLAGQQEEHTRRLRDWQARQRAFGAQPQWHGVGLPAGIDRVDVAGGTLGGWSALLAMLGGLRLAAGGRVTVLDFSAGAVAQDLLAAARASGIDPPVWVLPGDLPRFDLGAGLAGPALADVLAEAATAAGDPAVAADPAQETAILERIAAVLSPVPGGSAAGAVAGPSIAQLAAGLRVLAQAGEPGADVRRGLLTEAQAEAIGGLYGRAAADRVITERALALEAKLGKLASLGSAPVPLPPGGLRVVAVDRLAGRTDAQVLGSYVTAALTQLLRGEPRRGAASPPWRHTVLIAGAEQLRGDLLDRLSDACETTGTGLVLAYRSLPGHVRARLGRGNAAVAFMRLGNADDARVASEQLGTEHRFVIAQLTDTVGASVTDTAGQAYTSTVGTAWSVSESTTTSTTTGRSGGRGRSWTGFGAFAPPALSAHGERSHSAGVSDAVSAVAGVNQATAWGAQTAQAIGANNSLARTSQRSREFLVEPHQLQQLPPSAVIVSYASAAGRRVVLADANPGIGGLPSATLRGRDEPGPAAAAGWAAGTAWPAPATGEPATPGPPPGFGSAGPGQEWTQTVEATAETDHIRSRDSTAQTGRRPVPPRPAAPAAWGGPVLPPSRDPADAPLSWRGDGA